MSRTLITGMAATGKSTTVALLTDLGHRAVDLDLAQWSALVPDYSTYADRDGALDWRWRAAEVRALLENADEDLFVSGTSTDQGTLYPLLDHVVVLTVPEDVARERITHRTSNEYDKLSAELERELRLRRVVGPRLLAGACLVVDTSVTPPAGVVAEIVAHAALPH